MTESPLDADAVLAAAAADFVASARAAIDRCEASLAQLAARPDDTGLLEPVRQCLHRLNGSAATFGLAQAGRTAAAMEAVVRRWLADPALDLERRATVLAAFIAAERPLLDAAARAPRVAARRLLLVGVGDRLAATITADGVARGFTVERAGRDELDDAFADGVPFAVVAAAPAPEHAALRDVAVVELVTAGDSGAPPAPDAPRRVRVGVAAGAASAAGVFDALAALIPGAGGGVAGAALILDDDPVVRAVVGVAAARAGLRAAPAADLGAFRTALAAERPALVIVDVELGDASGLDVVAEVRARPECAGVPVLVLSGRDDAATREGARRAGASDFLTKPVDVPGLVAVLTAWRDTRAD